MVICYFGYIQGRHQEGNSLRRTEIRDGDGPSLLTRTLVDLAQRGESLSLDHEFLAEKFVAKLNPAVQAAGGVFNLGELIQFEVRLQLTSRLLGATSRSIDETSDNAFSSTIV